MYFFIILIGIFYGISQGTVSVALSAIVYYAFNIYDGNDIVYLLFDVNNAFYISVYVLIGVVSGYVTDKLKYEKSLAVEELDEKKEEVEFLDDI